MTKVCIFYDGVKEYRFDSTHFPVTIGGGQVDIALPSVSLQEGVAYVDFADGQPFIQPEDRSHVFLNQISLSQSSWLNDGDRIRMGASTISCKINQEYITLHLLPPVPDKNKVLQPPVRQENRAVPSRDEKTEDSNIERPEINKHQHSKNKINPIGAILLSGFFILLILAGFVFLATPVTFNVTPDADDLDVEGGLFSVKMAEHYLIWPGDYRIRIEKQGYITLNEPLQINRGSSLAFEFKLEKLGGVLSLNSEPVSGVDVSMDGKSLGQTPVAGIQVTPGQHEILFEHPRYQSDKLVIIVEGEGKQQTISGRLVPDWAVVDLNSEPPAANVVVDGKVSGITPGKLELLSGKHVIRLEKQGFEPWEESIIVNAGKNQNLELITLEKLPGLLVLQTTPSGVSVLVDGQFKGQTPIKLKLKPGQQHELKLFEAGFSELIQTVEIASGNEQKLDLQLMPKYGEIKLQGIPDGAMLYIDGKQLKSYGSNLKLTTRSHHLEVRKPGYQVYNTTITPRTGFPGLVTVNLKPVEQKTTPVKNLTSAEQSSLVTIRPGQFTMGASRREQGRRSNEVLHEVVLTRPFYIGKKEISNAEFRKFKPDHYSGQAKGLSLDDDQYPVVNVSWDDAARYCNWLSQKQGRVPVYSEKDGAMVANRPLSKGYRLPTEAEWAWVARYAGQAGKPVKYPWGQTFPVVANSGNYATGDNYTVTSPVATFKANKAGVYDIGGNISEWVNDYYSVSIDSGETSATDPLGPISGKHHVVRGASWRHSSISELRLSYRDYEQGKRSDLGFRVARYAD